MRLHLVEDWKQCYKWHSVRLVALFTTLQIVYANIPQRIHDDLPSWATQGIALALTVGIFAARMIAQPGKETTNGPDQPIQP